MNKAIKLFKEPRCKSCDLIASWPGIGNVSLIIARYLKEQLDMEEIGTIEPFDFFDPIGVMVRDNVIESPRFPESKFYFWQNPKTERGLVLFIGEEQPSSKGYELSNCVLDVCTKLKIKRVHTCAAAIAKIHHTEMPKVWAVATRQQLIEEMKSYDVVLRGALQIAGLNGIFLGAAKERGIDGVCLLGEVAGYTTRLPNPKAAKAILEILCQLLTMEVDLTELGIMARQADEEMKKLAAEAMGEFITSYTKPVWPQEEDEEDLDDEDDEEDEED